MNTLQDQPTGQTITMARNASAPWRRPRGWLRRWIGDPLATLFGGLIPGPAAVLRVARDDGSWRRIPIIVWPRGSDDHVVALFGITPWVTAIRHGARIELRRRGRREPIRLEELDSSATAEFLDWFIQANPGAARMYLAEGQGGKPDDGRHLADRHPVFRIVRDGSSLPA